MAASLLQHLIPADVRDENRLLDLLHVDMKEDQIQGINYMCRELVFSKWHRGKLSDERLNSVCLNYRRHMYKSKG